MRVEIEQLDEIELMERLRAAKIKSPSITEAMRKVFVKGDSMHRASKEVGINYAMVHRSVQRLRGICPHCGQALPKKSR